MSSRPTTLGLVLALWGVVGVMGLLLRAILSLTPKAIEAAPEMTAWQWGIAAAWVAFMAYSEGYRGFQQRFSPVVAARALVLAREPGWLRGLLAPAFLMGFFHATRRRLMVSWGVTLGVIGLIIAVRFLPQPWRGIVDMGVVVGLSWGLLSLVISVARALFSGHSDTDPCLPVHEATPTAAADPTSAARHGAS